MEPVKLLVLKASGGFRPSTHDIRSCQVNITFSLNLFSFIRSSAHGFMALGLCAGAEVLHDLQPVAVGIL